MAEESSGPTPQQDLVWFLGILGLLFVVWIFTGGPERYLNDPGPFLKPPAPLNTGDAYYIEGAGRWSLGSTFNTGGFGSGIWAGNTYGGGSSIENTLIDLQNQTDRLSDDIGAVREFGTPSPYRGMVSFEEVTSGAKLADNRTEYVVIRASESNRNAIPVTGWKVVSGVKNPDGTTKEAFIPNASPLPKTGEVNPVYGVTLRPGEKAFLQTGGSPLGVSFRVNICSGYLEQFQDFSPSLSFLCPSPQSEMRFSEQTIPYQYDCDAYVSTLPICEAVLKNPPSEYGYECGQFVKNKLTHNACVDTHKNRPGFYTGEWRIFLNKQTELWRNSREVIKLLDQEGKTVDMLMY